MLPNLDQYETIEEMLIDLKLSSACPVRDFEQVMFSRKTNMNSFGVLYRGILYTCAHTWKHDAAYFYRRFQSKPRDAYFIVSDRKAVPDDDVVMSTTGTKRESVPILKPVPLGFTTASFSQKLDEPFILTCLLDGKKYECTERWFSGGGKRLGLIPVISYLGLSGTGFVDDTGRLYLLIGSPENSPESGSIITPAWRN